VAQRNFTKTQTTAGCLCEGMGSGKRILEKKRMKIIKRGIGLFRYLYVIFDLGFPFVKSFLRRFFSKKRQKLRRL